MPVMAMQQGVANEIADVMVLEESRILGKDGALLRFFDIGFESHQSVFAGFVEQVVHHFQGVDIGLLAELGGAEDGTDTASDLFENVEWIRNEQRTYGGPTDDDQFCRLNENSEIAMLHKVAGHHTTEDDDDADDCKHS